MARPHPRTLAVFAILLLLGASLTLYVTLFREEYRPLHRLVAGELPQIADDLDTTSLIACARRQVAFLQRQDPAQTVAFGEDIYDIRWLLFSLEQFLEELSRKPDSRQLARFLSEQYIFYQAGGRKSRRGRTMLVTGYYEPVFDGSLARTPPFLTPLYAPPASLVSIPGVEGKPARIGRDDGNHGITRFWTRAEIETTGALAGDELVFLKDPFDAFLLHVQGSGRIRLPDGSIRAVRFAGSNGLEYRSIGKLLVDEGKMALEEVSIPAIRAYLQLHPEQRQRILHHNPRFIFFSWGDSLGPRGSSGEVLTPGRSIALDGDALPAATFGYLATTMPTFGTDGRPDGEKQVHRFVFPQDSGSAIQGTGRVDLFLGCGREAEAAASHMKQPGKLFLMVKKGYPGHPPPPPRPPLP